MTFTPADSTSLTLFVLFCAVMAALICFAVWKTGYAVKKFLLVFTGYMILFSAMAGSGLTLKYAVPFVPLLFASVMIGALAFGLSEYGRHIAGRFSYAVLIGFQSFRLLLELILHQWAAIGTVPPTMTWTGENLDILTGIVSLVAIPLVNRWRWLAWFAQWVGFLLLLNVLRVVIMSSPFPFAWPLEQPLQLIGYLPYAWIGPLFVGAALAGHIIVFRKLARN